MQLIDGDPHMLLCSPGEVITVTVTPNGNTVKNVKYNLDKKPYDGAPFPVNPASPPKPHNLPTRILIIGVAYKGQNGGAAHIHITGSKGGVPSDDDVTQSPNEAGDLTAYLFFL